MALTAEQRQIWLSEDFHRVVLADIEYHTGTEISTLRVSSSPYVMPVNDVTNISTYNFIEYPIDFSSWYNFESSVSTDVTTAPDGTTTADKIIANTVQGLHTVRPLGMHVGTVEHTFTLFAKIAEFNQVQIILFNNTDGSYAVANYNLNLVTADASASSIVDVGDGWYKLSISGTNTTGECIPVIRLTDLSGLQTFTGNNVDGIYIWGAHLGLGSSTLGYYAPSENLIYDDIISSVPNIVSRIDSSNTIGSINLLNTDGEFDYLLDSVVVTGHPIQIYIGDYNWPRDNFIIILDGIINSVSTPNSDTISLSLRDRKEILNVPLQSQLIDTSYWEDLMDRVSIAGVNWPLDNGGIGIPYSRSLAVLPEATEDTHVPICLGKCFNVEPVLVDSFNHIYLLHDSDEGILGIRELRANGIPLVRDTARNMLITSITNGPFKVDDYIYYKNLPTTRGHVYHVTSSFVFYYIDNAANDFSFGMEIIANIDSEPDLYPDKGLLTASNFNLDPAFNWSSGVISLYNDTAVHKFCSIDRSVISTTHLQDYVVTIIVENYTATGINSLIRVSTGYDGSYKTIIADGTYTYVTQARNITDIPTDDHVRILCNGGTGTMSADITLWSIKDYPVNNATGTATNPLPVTVGGVISNVNPQYEVNEELSTIRLLDHSQGTQITCDVIGQKGRSDLSSLSAADLVPYSAADIIEWILLEKAGIVFNDICQNTFPLSGVDGFDNISPLGVFYKEENNILAVITKIINSVGGFISFSGADCKIKLIKLIEPFGEVPDLLLVQDDVIEDGVSIAKLEEPKKSITLGYRKNWKTQDEGSLAQAITDVTSPYYNIDELNAFKNEYSSLYSTTGVSLIQYPLAQSIDLIETFIYNTDDAQNELIRRIGLRSQRRRVIKIQSLATSFTYSLGDIVNISYPRFGLDSGKNGIIIGIEESPTTKRVTLDIWL